MGANSLSRKGSLSEISPSMTRSVFTPASLRRMVPVFTSIELILFDVGTLVKWPEWVALSHGELSPKWEHWGGTVLVPMRSIFVFSSRRRHTRLSCDWTDVCSSD